MPGQNLEYTERQIPSQAVAYIPESQVGRQLFGQRRPRDGDRVLGARLFVRLKLPASNIAMPRLAEMPGDVQTNPMAFS